MDLRHEFTVPASIDQTWSAFNETWRVRRSIWAMLGWLESSTG